MMRNLFVLVVVVLAFLTVPSVNNRMDHPCQLFQASISASVKSPPAHLPLRLVHRGPTDPRAKSDEVSLADLDSRGRNVPQEVEALVRVGPA